MEIFPHLLLVAFLFYLIGTTSYFGPESDRMNQFLKHLKKMLNESVPLHIHSV